MSPNLNEAKRIRESAKWFLLSEELIPKGSLVLAAVSGGPDSMAMLSMLEGLSTELEFRLAVAHFDHGLREEGDEEKAVVERFASGLGLTMYAGAADVRAAASASDDTIEEAARKARYAFLRQVAGEIHADRIATGHTSDDQVETILMRILRGTGIRGLAGIPVKRGKIIRPILCLSHEDAARYCEAAAIPSVVDPSNSDPRFFRNRLRSELLPVLRKTYDGVEGNLLRLARNAADVISEIRTRTRPLIAQSLKKETDKQWVLDLSRLTTLDDTALVVLFGDVFAEDIGCDLDFSRPHYEQLIKLVRDTRASGKKLNLPGLTVTKEYENLIIACGKANASVDPAWESRATLTFPGTTTAAGVTVTTEILDSDDVDELMLKAEKDVAYFPLRGLKLPLVLRSPVAGDRIRPFGMNGTKKLSDVFSDKKIPGRKRQKSLVVADADEILWLVGVTTSEKGRVARSTGQIVKISVHPYA